MRVEIFEAPGYQLETDHDAALLNFAKRGALTMAKVSIMDRAAVAKHKDVVAHLREHGLETLPIVKIDGRIVTAEKLDAALARL